MRKVLLLSILTISLSILYSCDEETNEVTVPEGMMSVTLNGASNNMAALAKKTTRTFKEKTYFSLVITPENNISDKLILQVYKSSISASVYKLPTYVSDTTLNPVNGYAAATYITANAKYVVDGKNSKGEITILTIDDKKVTGEYNVTLVNSIASDQKITLKGEFNLKFYSTSLK